jgi:hypothetical protein
VQEIMPLSGLKVDYKEGDDDDADRQDSYGEFFHSISTKPVRSLGNGNDKVYL